MDALIFPLALLFMVVALVRRFDAVTLTLVAGLLAGMAVDLIFPRAMSPVVLSLLEALVGLAMLRIVTGCYNRGNWCERARRAQVVGTISAVKCFFMFWWVFDGGVLLNWNSVAAMFNAGLFLQILVAGGWGDGLAVFIARHWNRFRGGSLGSLQGRGH
jgi:hypothetical protein